MRSFGAYYLGVILRPRRSFDALVHDQRALRFGFYAIGLNAIAYTLVYVFLTIGGGAPSAFVPWLAIPAEDYYFYNRYLLAPSMFAAWLLAAAVAQLASRGLGGAGRFEDLLAVFGFGIGVASLASLAHDLPDTFLGAVGLLDLRAYEVALNSPTVWRAILLTLYGLSGVWFLVLFPKGVAAAQGLSAPRSILVGALAYAAYQGVFVIFNR